MYSGKKRIKKISFIILLFSIICITAACAAKNNSFSTGEITLSHNEKFGGVNLHISPEEIQEIGFKLGDSVNVSFSNGYELKDIPLYDGYYTNVGEPLLCAYPGNRNINCCIDTGEDMFLVGNLTEDCTAVITSGKRVEEYEKMQSALGLHYSDERSDYDSDIKFANFRPMSGGNLAENLFFRSASPCDNVHNRVKNVNESCKDAGINYVIDLADNADEVMNYYKNGSADISYWKKLYERGNVLPLSMNSNYRNEKYMKSVATLMRAVSTEQGPFLIHCTEGKDRTGFVCLLIEILAGASIEELEADYMKTYENYYGITKKDSSERYDIIVDRYLKDIYAGLCGTDKEVEFTPEMLSIGVENYLMNAGLSKNEIESLKKAIKY